MSNNKANSNQAKIESFSLQSFVEKGEDKVVDFKLAKIEQVRLDDEGQRKILIQAKGSDFAIAQEVKDYKGLSRREEEDLAERLDELLNEKYGELSESAFQEGKQKGEEEGFKDGQQKATKLLEEKINQLDDLIASLTSSKLEMAQKYEQEMKRTLNTVAKWICLKDIEKDQTGYLERVVSKIMQEVGDSSEYKLHVSDDFFKTIEETSEKMQFADKVSIVRHSEWKDKSVAIETVNGLVDASITEQFSKLDKLIGDS